jgi:AraC family transcriptional regulator
MERLDGRVAGRRSRHGPREITLMGAGETNHFTGPAGSAWGQLYLDTRLLFDVASELRGTPPATIELRDDAVFVADGALRRRLDGYLARAQDRLEPPIALEMDARALLIAVDLLRGYSTLGRPARPSRHELGAVRFRRIEEYVEANLGEDLPLGVLAEVVGLSPKHFSRAFRATTGQPPHRWLVERRVREAQRLLRDPSLPLAEIAALLGFADQSHFTATFRRVTGLTPGAQRRQLLGADTG